LINDARQAAINTSRLQVPGPMYFRANHNGGYHDDHFYRSERSTQADDQSFKTIALFSCFGLVVSFGMMIIGVDLSVGWL
jgi:hypothetical protein